MRGCRIYVDLVILFVCQTHARRRTCNDARMQCSVRVNRTTLVLIDPNEHVYATYVSYNDENGTKLDTCKFYPVCNIGVFCKMRFVSGLIFENLDDMLRQVVP